MVMQLCKLIDGLQRIAAIPPSVPGSLMLTARAGEVLLSWQDLLNARLGISRHEASGFSIAQRQRLFWPLLDLLRMAEFSWLCDP